MSSSGPMKSIDQAIMDQLDKLKDQPGMQKLIEKYNILEEHEQKITNFALMAVPIVLPAIVVFIFFLISHSVKSEIQAKEDIVLMASRIISKKSQINRFTGGTNFGNKVTNNSSLNNTVNSIAGSAGIDTAKIKISNFDQFEDTYKIEVSAKIKFTGISNKNLMGLLEGLFIKNKFKVANVEVTKNKSTNLLNGSFEVSYLSKPKPKPKNRS